MPTVEGLTPEMIWTFMYVLIGFGLLFLIGFRVYDAIHVINERKRHKDESEKPDFAEKVSKKVIAELGPRLENIEDDLAKDKKRLELHELAISNMQTGQKDIREGLTAIAKFLLVINTYSDISQNDNVKKAASDLNDFLAEKL